MNNIFGVRQPLRSQHFLIIPVVWGKQASPKVKLVFKLASGSCLGIHIDVLCPFGTPVPVLIVRSYFNWPFVLMISVNPTNLK
jgi:hypothetical protein